jgi:diguanylate cyclase (GGDEF)-like protein
MSDSAYPLRLVEHHDPVVTDDRALVESYRRLADVFHDVLGEQSLDALLDRIAGALSELVPHDSLTIYEADEPRRLLQPVWARDQWADKILADTCPFGVGLTGWGVEHREAVRVNQAHLDPRVETVSGTPPDEPEALITVPLIARDSIKGALNIYRLGEEAAFDDEEFELAKRFADAAALALDNAQIRARLEHQAQTDPLTGLYNHRYFHERLRSELTTASRSHDVVSVLMLDIDDFKRVNDIFGHGAGDEILRALALTLRGCVRLGDVVCRLGGEEFAIVMTSRSPENAERLARRLVDRVAEEAFDPAGRITVSVGLARGPEHAMNPRELIACAEAAMMTAKARGKNRIVVYDDDDQGLERPEGEAVPSARHVRSIAHMKMLQSLGGKLNRLNDVREIGNVIANELRSLIDYHNCRIVVADGENLVPIAFVGTFTRVQPSAQLLTQKLSEGITGHVATTGECLLVGDAANHPLGKQVAGTDRIDESQIYVPLRFGTRVIGVIVLSKLGLDQFDEDDVRLLEVLAGHAAVALENASLYEAARREAERATLLLEFSRELAKAEDLDDVAGRVVDLAARALWAPQASVWLQEEVGDDVRVAAMAGYSELERGRLVRSAVDSERAAEFLARAEPFVLHTEDGEEGCAEVSLGRSCAVAPIALDGGRLGSIVVTAPDEQCFSEQQLQLLAGIAHQAKLALTNAGNFRNLEQTFLETVEALANACEANDEYTSSHARWITDLSLKVGEGLGLDARQLKRLELGALFHDIGKIGIPQHILQKPGPLTDDERAVMETHPELGERIIAPIDRLEEVRPIVRHCHERYDGGGYPDRMVGEEIPIESRIIFVCDAFHAMTTDRPYRRRLPDEEALRRLDEAAGTQFDPAVVEVCRRVLELQNRD